MNNKYIFGVDIGGTTVKIGLFDDKINLLEKWAISTNNDKDNQFILFQNIQDSLLERLNLNGISLDDVIGIGIGLPGPIVNRTHLISKCANINLDPCDITKKFKLPEHIKIVVENDANMATLGEYISGSGNLCSNLCLITLGTGIGAGIISNGKLVSGKNGAAGEIGHIKLSCAYLDELSSNDFMELEKLVSGISIEKLAHRFLELDKYKTSIFKDIQPCAKNIFENRDDILAKVLIEIMSKYLALGVSYLCSTTNPEKVIFGGGVAAAEGLIQNIKKYFDEYASYFVSKDVEFLRASLGNDAGIFGSAASVIFDNFDNDYIDFLSIVGKENIRTDISGKDITTFKTGGKIRYFITPETTKQLHTLIKYIENNTIKYFIVGKGSNILIPDEGYNGVILSLSKIKKPMSIDENNVLYSSSNENLKDIALFAYDNALTGFEFAHGIPGTLGGALYMNAGAYGSEMKDVILKVEVLDKSTGEILTLTNSELDFSYRNSKLKKDNAIVIGAYIALSKGDKESIKTKIDDLYARRTEKQPLDFPSAGSTFKRPPNAFAGELIMLSGLKGYSYGGAKVSEKHAGFIINYNNATTDDILTLISIVKNTVKIKHKIELEPEVILIK